MREKTRGRTRRVKYSGTKVNLILSNIQDNTPSGTNFRAVSFSEAIVGGTFTTQKGQRWENLVDIFPIDCFIARRLRLSRSQRGNYSEAVCYPITRVMVANGRSVTPFTAPASRVKTGRLHMGKPVRIMATLRTAPCLHISLRGKNITTSWSYLCFTTQVICHGLFAVLVYLQISNIYTSAVTSSTTNLVDVPLWRPIHKLASR